jgi:hypothetical protein
LRYISAVPVSDLLRDAPFLDRKTSRLNWAYSYESYTATILPDSMEIPLPLPILRIFPIADAQAQALALAQAEALAALAGNKLLP